MNIFKKLHQWINAKSEPLSCVDCGHYRPYLKYEGRTWDVPICLKSETKDMVTGKPQYKSCRIMRDEACGERGVFFKQGI